MPNMPLRRGAHRLLEEEANRLIRESLRGVTKHSEKSDILTPWKEGERRRREVYVASGSPEAHMRRGMFHRAANASRPDLNSREGIAPARRGVGSISNFVDTHGGTNEYDD
jgi:hypothetical protein